MTAATDTEIALDRKRKTGTRCATTASTTRTASMSGSTFAGSSAREPASKAITPAQATVPT